MNSDERIEVAERLRKGGIARNAKEAYVVLLSCIGIRPQLPADATYQEALERLANLIDPTCRVSDEEVAHQPTLDALAVHVYTCSACRNSFYMADVCCHPKPAYCPYCGARVVGGDE